MTWCGMQNITTFLVRDFLAGYALDTLCTKCDMSEEHRTHSTRVVHVACTCTVNGMAPKCSCFLHAQ